MLAVAVVACWAPASGLAATSPWATRANAICASWSAKAKAALGTTAPKTQSQIYAYMVKARPIEAGLLRDLRAISVPRPAGANRGLAFAAADIREIDSALAAYRAGHKTAFVKDAEIWQSDHRTSDAFAAIGARACG
jgi:hypothetical protein